MRYRIIETRLGSMAIGWSGVGLARVLLPGDPVEVMRARLDAEDGVEEPCGLADLAARVVGYAEGVADDFADVVVDLSGVSTFNRRIYRHIRGLGWGETTTYGTIARWLGDVGKARAVGAAMGANPIPLVVPCHRVLAADGKMGGFSSPRGAIGKLEMLVLERAMTPNGQLSFGF